MNLESVRSLILGNLSSSEASLASSIERLSSGLKSPADDPAGFIYSESLRVEIVSLGEALKNTVNADYFLGTAESALAEVSGLLDELRTIIQDSHGVHGHHGKKDDEEIKELVGQIFRVIEGAEYAGEKIFTEESREVTFLVGAQLDDTVSVHLVGSNSLDKLNRLKNNPGSIKYIDDIAEIITRERAKLGAFQSGAIKPIAENLRTQIANLQVSESSRSIDFATEYVNFEKSKNAVQVNLALLAKTNDLISDFYRILLIDA